MSRELTVCVPQTTQLRAFLPFRIITALRSERGREDGSYSRTDRTIVGSSPQSRLPAGRMQKPQPKPARLNDARVRHTPSATDQLFTEVLTGGITTKTNEWRRGLGEGVVVIFRSEICDLRVSIYASAYRPLNRLTPESAAWGDEGQIYQLATYCRFPVILGMGINPMTQLNGPTDARFAANTTKAVGLQ